MLVLSRKPKEIIRIGDNIRVIVQEVKGGRVRLSIDAPADVRVHRGEVYEAIKRENSEQ
jgi:carbon storage regulator